MCAARGSPGRAGRDRLPIKEASAEESSGWMSRTASCGSPATFAPTAAIRGMEVAERAVELSQRRDPTYLRTLASAYAKARQFNRAETVVREAMGLAETGGNEELLSGLRDDLARYDAQP